MRTMTYSELAYEVISSYVQEDQIPAEDLRDIINRSFSTFRTKGKSVFAVIKEKNFVVTESC